MSSEQVGPFVRVKEAAKGGVKKGQRERERGEQIEKEEREGIKWQGGNIQL